MQQDFYQMNKELSRLEKQELELYHRLAVQAGLSDSAFSILAYLYEQQDSAPHTQNSLAKYLWLPKQTVNSAVNRLAADGYVVLQQMAVARNSKAVRLTPQGEAFCRRWIQPILEAVKRSLTRMSDAEIETYFALSKKQALFLQQELCDLLNTPERPANE